MRLTREPDDEAPEVIRTLSAWKWLRRMFVGHASDERLSQLNPKRKEGRLYLGVGVLGLMLVGAFGVFMHYPAWRKASAAREWPVITCEVIELDIRKTSHGHENTYAPAVFYEYQFQGRTYRSKRTHLETMELDDLASATAFLKLYAVGGISTCYVNPANPQEAVLDRSYSVVKSAGFILILFALDCFLILYGASKLSQARREMVPLRQVQTGLPLPLAGPRPEKVTLSPPEVGWGGRILAIILMAGSGAVLYWIVSNCLETRRVLGEFDVSGFQFIGGMFAFIVFCAGAVVGWKTFDPFPVVELRPGSPRLGEMLEVKWNFRGPIGRVRTVSIWLEGREEVMAEDKVPGKRVSHPTEKSLSEFFFFQRVAEPEGFAQKVCGTAYVQVPQHMMPTFEAEKTNIKWVVRFEGAIAWSLSMKHEFPVTVLPGERGLSTANSARDRAIPA